MGLLDELSSFCISWGSKRKHTVSWILSDISMSKLLWKVTPPCWTAYLIQKLHFILKAEPNGLRKGKEQDQGEGRAEGSWEITGVWVPSLPVINTMTISILGRKVDFTLQLTVLHKAVRVGTQGRNLS